MIGLDKIIEKVEIIISDYVYRQKQAEKKALKWEAQRKTCKDGKKLASLYHAISMQRFLMSECDNVIFENSSLLKDLQNLQIKIVQ